ncbi:MAG TPA: PhnA domain-containing protein [Cyclobacteriaceae bacterium]|nr:PhnA domain-containing protein [Cyclobacteriaceae bacterium]
MFESAFLCEPRLYRYYRWNPRAPKPIKAATKVKNIRITDGDHNIDCRVDGFGAMALKSIYVRKA